MTKNVEIIFRYVLLKIYTRKWQQGVKMPSKKAFAIKFNCSVNEVMQALNKLKQNGFVSAKDRLGYHVAKNDHSYFFYSISDFYASRVKTKAVTNFHLPPVVVKLILTHAPIFKSFTTASITTIKREYYYAQKVAKQSYFIFQTTIFKQFQDSKLLHQKPLYEFLALNGFISAQNRRFGFFSDLPSSQPSKTKKRSWVVVEFVYDINNLPLAILVINYLDLANSNILYKRNDGIY